MKRAAISCVIGDKDRTEIELEGGCKTLSKMVCFLSYRHIENPVFYIESDDISIIKEKIFEYIEKMFSEYEE